MIERIIARYEKARRELYTKDKANRKAVGRELSAIVRHYGLTRKDEVLPIVIDILNMNVDKKKKIALIEYMLRILKCGKIEFEIMV